MIFQGSSTDQWSLFMLSYDITYDDHVIIMKLSYDDHKMFIKWQCDDLLKNISEGSDLIWKLSAVDYHVIMIMTMIMWPCDHVIMVFILWSSPWEMSWWYGFDTREMSRWFVFCISGDACVSTHVEVETFIAGYSGDVKMVWFRYLGRCLVVCRHKFRWRLLWLFTREMSRWFGSTYSGAAWMCVDTCLGGAFYRGLLGRCKDGLVLLTREPLECVSTHV